MIFEAGTDRDFKRAINKLSVNPRESKILWPNFDYEYLINSGSVSEFSRYGQLMNM